MKIIFRGKYNSKILFEGLVRRINANGYTVMLNDKSLEFVHLNRIYRIMYLG